MAGQATTKRSRKIRVRRRKKSLNVSRGACNCSASDWPLLREDTPSPSDDEEVDEQQRSEYLEDMGCLEKYFSDLKEMSVPNT